MAEALRIQPLEGRMFAGNGVTLTPAPAAKRFVLRAPRKSVATLSRAIGVKLPVRPNTSTSAKGLLVLWIAPDEWLVIGEPAAGLETGLAKMKDTLFSAVDVSHRNTAVLASGPNAVLAMASGCPRDLRESAFGVGACARTILGKSEVVLFREGKEQFRVECWRSFSDYVWHYLCDAAKSA